MRQLKNFLRHRKAQMLACDCGCRTLKCWRESACDCAGWGDSPTPPTPGFTYTFNKTTTRWRTDLYTAEKFVTGEDVPVGSYTLSVKYGDSELEYDVVKIGDWTDWKELPDIYIHNEPDVVRTTYVGNAEAALTEWTQEAYKAIYEDYENFMENSAENIYFAAYGVEWPYHYLSVVVSSFATHSEAEWYDIIYDDESGNIAQNYWCDEWHVTTVEQQVRASNEHKKIMKDYMKQQIHYMKKLG